MNELYFIGSDDNFYNNYLISMYTFCMTLKFLNFINIICLPLQIKLCQYLGVNKT